MRFFDFLFLRPFFTRYFIERVRYFITVNIATNGMTMILYINAQGERMVGMVFKYPYVRKIVMPQSLFSQNFPNLLIKYQQLARMSWKISKRKK